MRKHFLSVLLLAFFAVFTAQANEEPGLKVSVNQESQQGLLRAAGADGGGTYYIRGNDDKITFTITASGLKESEDVKIVVPGEFVATPSELPYNVVDGKVVVTLRATKPESSGTLYIIAGVSVKTYQLVGIASALPEKDLSQNPIVEDESFAGTVSTIDFYDSDGFTPGKNGFTIEFTAQTPNAISSVNPFAITEQGIGFQAFTRTDGFGINNSTLGWGDKIIYDKEAQLNGGSGIFPNDGKFHTYRYAVAPDNRIHIYRDGLLVDLARTADYGLQPSFQDGEGDYEENLLVNGDFEGEYEYLFDDPASKILSAFEGWNIGAQDRWNSEQFINNVQIPGVTDISNHVFTTQRYAWQDGWGAAEYGQIVDVVPGETYSLTALVRGGYSTKDSKYLGSLRIQEVKGTELANEKKVDITSDDWQEYALEYTTSATAKQIRVDIYLERGSTWSTSPSMDVDNIQLTGARAAYTQKIGLTGRAASVGYFSFDATGAYAPVKKEIALSTQALTIDGTNQTATFKVTPSQIITDITLTAPSGFTVSPQVIVAGTGETTVTVKHVSTLPDITGTLILNTENIYGYVELTGIGTPLAEKDLSKEAILEEESIGASAQTFEYFEEDGFVPSANGYTVEFSALTPNAISYINPFAVTEKGIGFQGYARSDGAGIANSTLGWLDKPFVNPAAQDGLFRPDGEYHTYRYAVTSDNRIHAYRDGLSTGIFRAQDFGLQPSFQDGEGDYEENLLVNGDFEGEYAFIADDPASKILASIEGWNIAANDRWNSEQFIEKQEIASEGLDFNNHILRVNRYAWQNGWGAAEYSEIVDVVPGETYSLSALAKGGYSSRVGGYLGSLRIQEVKGADLINEKKVDVTSDDWQEYNLEYTTSTSAKQIRVDIYLERGDTWSQDARMYVDNAKLTGSKAAYTTKVGFTGRAANVAYFNFDKTGAYAPLFSGIDVIPPTTGIHKVSDEAKVTASVLSGVLYFNNVAASSAVSIYNASGSLVKKIDSYTGGIALPQRGFYIAVIKNGNETKSVKVIY